MTSTPHSSSLARRLGLRDAVVIGLASMIGAGAFVSLGAAQDLAGVLAPLAVLLAAGVALCNATSTAQLAAQHPTSGGTYHFGREQLGPWWGFLAGWCFVIGKIASCAAMALVIAAYLVPVSWHRPVAALIVAVLTAVNLVGITRTAALARVLVTIAITALTLTAVRLLIGVAGVRGEPGGQGEPGVPGEPGAPGEPGGQGSPSGGLAAPDTHAAGEGSGILGALWDGGLPALLGGDGGPLTVLATLQAAAIMFFAFAGYARVATLGEEVTEPRRTIPRAILAALGIVAALYLALSLVLVIVSGTTGQPGDAGWGPAPFRAALESVGAGGVWLLIVSIGAVAAASGALLALVAGISRTMLAMARNRDLPPVLAHVSPRFSVPQRAEIAAGAGVLLLVLLASDVLVAVAASSFGVLLYYAIANLSALTQQNRWRLYPRPMQILGLLGCLALVIMLPGSTIAAGLLLIGAGVLYRLAVAGVRGARASA
ncbi:APC family permease [Brachybacterium sp. UMB0905]|uniref:APC family permease n=1 Tax=Brachybacterium sp. UMB0905 TaxID=2069310 RepID=UPI001E4D5C1A|nr:APC family permease [Brachybacterium sp. UMB0905]